MSTPSDSAVARRLGRGALISSFPILVGLFVGSTTFPGGSILPWHPVMVDLGVYLEAGRLIPSHGDIYQLPGSLPFLYPPFAALLALPLAELPAALVQIGWVVANVLALLAIMYRLGLRGWPLSLLGAIATYFVEPANQTLAFGQVGIFMTALVIFDLVPGERLLGGTRWSPTGLFVGLATAIKLTPGLFMIYLFAVRRRRAAIVSILTMLAATALAGVILPGETVRYWVRLAQGDTGLGHSVVYYTNQSLYANFLRVFGLGSAHIALVVCALIALLGVWAGLLWHRRGKIALGVSLCGVAGLLASPVSWSHHFIWVIPLAIALTDKALPGALRYLGYVFVGWVVGAPFKRLPNGADVELSYNWWQNLLDSMTSIFGLALIIMSIIIALHRRSASRRQSSADRRDTDKIMITD